MFQASLRRGFLCISIFINTYYASNSNPEELQDKAMHWHWPERDAQHISGDLSRFSPQMWTPTTTRTQQFHTLVAYIFPILPLRVAPHRKEVGSDHSSTGLGVCV
jgi:hypothetical protein